MINFHQTNKYQAKRAMIDGKTFDSLREMRRYQELRLLENSGTIKDLRCQEPYQLQPPYKNKEGKHVREIVYIADFVYFDQQKGMTVEDVKGFRTKEYIIKRKIFCYQHPEITFIET